MEYSSTHMTLKNETIYQKILGLKLKQESKEKTKIPKHNVKNHNFPSHTFQVTKP